MTDRTLNLPEVEGGDLAAATLTVASPVPVYRGRR